MIFTELRALRWPCDRNIFLQKGPIFNVLLFLLWLTVNKPAQAYLMLRILTVISKGNLQYMHKVNTYWKEHVCTSTCVFSQITKAFIIGQIYFVLAENTKMHTQLYSANMKKRDNLVDGMEMQEWALIEQHANIWLTHCSPKVLGLIFLIIEDTWGRQITFFCIQNKL